MRNRLWSLGCAKKKLAVAYHFARTSDQRGDGEEFDCGHCKKLKLHKGRNCKLFFPLEWLTGRKDAAWKATYKHRDKWEHQRKISGAYEPLASTVITECPTSLITSESKWFLGEYFAATTAHREFGAIKYGTNPDRWPAWWFDVVSVLARAKDDAEAIETSE